MNPIRHIRRIAAVLAALAGVLVALAAAPAALAQVVPPGPQSRYDLWTPASPHHALVPASSHAAAAIGTPGWQIALIAIGAALLAATVAVLAGRARAARRPAAA